MHVSIAKRRAAGLSLRVVSAGPGATIQDAGRFGYLRYGVVASGPMDWIAYDLANRALKNPSRAACIEISLGGLELECAGEPVAVAFAGGGFDWTRNGERLPSAAVVQLQPGNRLRASAGAWGTWTYLAVEGGVDVPLVLASRSTYARFSIGGLDGRALRAGDILSSRAVQSTLSATIVSALVEKSEDPIRVILGPQDDYFTREAIETLFSQTYAISARFDRMGYWLDGPRLEHAGGYDIVSDGIPLGGIQVPGSGQPLVLMADHQATGGYPKIATVIRADIGRFAQNRPGESVRFAPCDQHVAREALLRIDAVLSEIALAPFSRGISEESLLASNLISGVVDGSDMR